MSSLHFKELFVTFGLSFSKLWILKGILSNKKSLSIDVFPLFHIKFFALSTFFSTYIIICYIRALAIPLYLFEILNGFLSNLTFGNKARPGANKLP